MAEKKPAALFDFDDTLFYGDSILHWNVFMFRKHPRLRLWRPIHGFAILLWCLRLISTSTLKRFALLPTAHLSAEEREKLAEQFVCEVLPGYLYPEVIRRLKIHREAGLSVLVLSASPELWVQHLPKILPVDQVIGTQMEWPDKGWLRLPRYRSVNFKGHTKVEWLRLQQELPADGKGCIAYSDHHSDIPMLEFAESAVMVHPTAKMEKHGNSRNWSVLRPRRPKEGWRRLLQKGWMLLMARHVPGPLHPPRLPRLPRLPHLPQLPRRKH